MSLRFLATGDIQANNWKQFSYLREDGYNSRLHNCLKVFDVLRKEAKKRGISKVLINGDLFEKNAFIETEVYDAVYQKIEKLADGLEVCINLGNHDVLRANGRLVHSLRPLRKVASVIEIPTLVWERLWIVPWMAKPEKLKQAIKDIPAESGQGLVLHCGVQGAVTGPTSYLVRNPIKLEDIRRKEFELVILSDYHTRQSLAKNVWYLGSPLQHSFGEIHRPCIWEIVLDRRGYVAKKLYTHFPSFVHTKANRPGDLHEGSLWGNYVRVTLRPGSKITAEEVEDYAKGRFLVRVEHEGEEKVTSKSVHTLAPEEAIARYVIEQAKEEHQERLVELGDKLYRGEG